MRKVAIAMNWVILGLLLVAFGIYGPPNYSSNFHGLLIFLPFAAALCVLHLSTDQWVSWAAFSLNVFVSLFFVMLIVSMLFLGSESILAVAGLASLLVAPLGLNVLAIWLKLGPKRLALRNGLYIGAVLLCIDLGLWVFVEVVPGVVTRPSELVTFLAIEGGHTWYRIRLATHWLVLPELIPYMPSHGGGAVAATAFFLYVATCLLQTFLVGFVIGSLGSSIRKRGHDCIPHQTPVR